MNLPVISTTRLGLRPLTLADADALHHLLITPGVRKFLWDDEIISAERAASVVQASIDSFATGGLCLWAVFPQNDENLIGFSGFWFFHDPPRLQLLYGIAPSHWGQGLATEVAQAMIRYGFEELSLERIEASTDAPNLASVRVMEKAGMKFQKQETSNGRDTIYYDIEREDYQIGAVPYSLRK